MCTTREALAIFVIIATVIQLLIEYQLRLQRRKKRTNKFVLRNHLSVLGGGVGGR